MDFIAQRPRTHNRARNHLLHTRCGGEQPVLAAIHGPGMGPIVNSISRGSSSLC